MSSEIPALPNKAPEDMDVEETSRKGPMRPPLKPAPGQAEPEVSKAPAESLEGQGAPEADSPAGEKPAAAKPAEPTASEQPSEPSKPAEPEKTPAPGRPGSVAAKPVPPPPVQQAPAMPAMPAAPEDADFEDDDIEIPDEDELARMIEAQEKGVGEEESKPGESSAVIEGVIVSVRDDGCFVDVGEKSEAFLPWAGSKRLNKPDWKPGETIEVTIKGQAPDGYLLLSNVEAARPTEWAELETAYATSAVVVGKAVEVVKGGLAVDVGARAFLPASRSGERDQESLEALVGQEIRCRIAQLDIDDRNVVLDRRAVIEEERRQQRQVALEGLAEGAVITGVVRNIRDFGAFVDLGGVDALLHISDISWGRVSSVDAVLNEGDEVQVKVLRIDEEGRRIAVGLKQLQEDPWNQIASDFHVGDKVKGTVTRLKEFGAFVELLPGAEGLIHISEMSWSRRLRHPNEVVQVGDEVEVVVLDLNLAQKRVALGLKQALGDPWDRAEEELQPGATVEGVVRKLTSFGAFVEVMEGVEGLLHISDITSERRLNHPSEALRVDEKVRVKVLDLMREKRRLKLGMKQLEPTEQDRFLEQIQPGDTVTGRVLGMRGSDVEVELGEGVRGFCTPPSPEASPGPAPTGGGGDVGSMGARLAAAWRGGEGSSQQASGELQRGELRSFRVTGVDSDSGAVQLELAQ